MPRPKGSKNKPKKRPKINYGAGGPPIIRDKAALEEIAANRDEHVQKSSNVSLKGMAENDRIYFLSLFEVLAREMETLVPINFPEDAHANYRYTPKQMWDNISAYFQISINYGQPLTLTAMAMFCGIGRTTILAMRDNPKLHPSYEFVKRCCEFVENYNEYALHKKQNPAGPIFVLKNLGWKDKLEIEATANNGALSEEERAAAQKRMVEISE